MTPLYLSFQAFGPYIEKQEIDLAALAAEGLFLIRGETGAGKTVILDAITYALYGKSSGGSRGDLVSMRCQNAPETLPTEVTLLFDADGRKCRFLRRLRLRHKRGTDAVEFLPEQDAQFETATGEWQPFFENPTLKRVEEQAIQLTGLRYDQFRQVVMLPQGQFERLLVADSEEKTTILQTLFGTEEWELAVQRLIDMSNQKRKALDEKQQQVNALLAAHDCERIEALAEKQTQMQDRLVLLKKQLAETDRQGQKAEQTLQKATQLAQEFQRLRDAERTFETLQRAAPQMEEKRRLLGLRALSDIYEQYRVGQTALGQMCLAVEREQKTLRTTQAQAITLQNDWKAAQDTLEACRAAAAALPTQEAKCTAFMRQRQMAQNVVKLAKAIAEAENGRKELEHAYRQCLSESTAAENAYFSGIAAELAQGLQQGERCPVCGSIAHPQPAASVGKRVQRNEIAERHKAVESAHAALAAADARIDILQTQLAGERETLRQAGGYDEAAHRVAVAEQKKTATQAQGLSGAQTNIQLLTRRQETLQKQAEAQQKELTQQTIRMERLDASAKLLEGQLAALDPNGAGRTQLDRRTEGLPDFAALEQALKQYDIQKAAAAEMMREQRENLQGQTAPDLPAAKNEAERWRKAKLEGVQKIAVWEKELATGGRDMERLQKQMIAYDAARRDYDAFSEFVRLLRGTNGVSLQRYVLGVMLSAVTGEANRLLSRVHDGRYQLYRTLETAGNTRKAGLELEVFDRNSGKRRSVVSLSGGEKFLTALSLSIGLSAVVQAQSGGVRLGAIFIDEGFGTLDDASLHDALRVLAAIRDTHGMVGIISHVELLQEHIIAGIEVKKGRTGSTIAMR